MAQEHKLRRRWPGLAGIAVGAIVAVLWFTVIRPAVERARVRRLVASFRSQPDPTTAQALADLLDRQALPQALGNEILELLATPDVTVRSAYPAGHRPCIAARGRFGVGFAKSLLPRRRFVWTQGQEQQGSMGSPNSLSRSPQLWTLSVPTEPGVYPCALDYRFALVPEKEHKGRGSWEERTAGAVYRCAFRIPFDVRIVEANLAEQVTRRSSPALDAAMRAAIRPSTAEMHQGCGLPGGGSCDVTGKFAFEVDSLPENVGFHYIYRDHGGLTLPVRGETLRLRAGRPAGEVPFPVVALRLPEGRYEGMAILEPDELAAYPDPAIKIIWGGTIELPISFVVRVTEGGGQPEGQQ